MNRKRLLIFAALVLSLLWGSAAWAGNGHSPNHAHGMKGAGVPVLGNLAPVVSPFEPTLADKRLHCDLLRHNPLLPCPHHKVPPGEEKHCIMANDCGGQTGFPIYKSQPRLPFVPVQLEIHDPGSEEWMVDAPAVSTPSPVISVITPPPELS